MAKAIPAIASIGLAIATGGASAVLAGTATFAQFASVAGAALSGIGALTGKKDIAKIGGFLSLAGAATSLFSGVSAAAEASSSMFDGVKLGGDAAAAAGDMGGDIIDSIGGMEGGSAVAGESLGSIESPSLMNAKPPTAGDIAGGQGIKAPGLMGIKPTIASPTSIMGAPSTSVSTGGMYDGVNLGAPKSIASYASTASQSDLSKMLTSAEKWANQHKTVLDIGLRGVASMTDPNSKMLEEQRRMMDRRLRNLNSPVALGRVGG